MPGDFVWDSEKAAKNARKHRVTFEEAMTIFTDPRSLTIYDEEHSAAEDRYVSLGRSEKGRLLVVVHADADEDIRLISARKATKSEQEQYGTP